MSNKKLSVIPDKSKTQKNSNNLRKQDETLSRPMLTFTGYILETE